MKLSAFIAVISAALLLGSPLLAQSSSSPPSDVPADAATAIGAPAMSQMSDASASEAPEVGPETLAGDQYIYTTLRVITAGDNRGCGASDWSCMSRLCAQDLGQGAWRGWVGCNPDGNDFICYFECARLRDLF